MSVNNATTSASPAGDYGVLATVPLLEGLKADDLAALAPNIERRIYEKGETLFLIGDPGGALLIVVTGAVDLFVFDDDNKRIVLSQVVTGGFFGEVSLFDNSQRTANAIATERTEIIILRQKIMVDFLEKHPNAAIHIINVLSARLRDTTMLVTNRQGNAYEVMQRKSTPSDKIADRAANAVGSWRYLIILVTLVFGWILLNELHFGGGWDQPPAFSILALVITALGALQLPLILMSQRRQGEYEQIADDLDHEVNVRAQLAILEVTRKLDWLQDAMVEQAERVEKIEKCVYTAAESAQATGD